MRRGMWAILAWALLPLSAFAGTLPQNYTVQEHGYIWRADGSSATQGSGSITSWPTRTSGTASCTMSQVLIGPDGLPGPLDLPLIKMDCTAGASPSTVQIPITFPAQSIAAIGNFGLFYYDPSPGDNSMYTGPNFLIGTSGLAKYNTYGASSAQVGTARKQGWNLIVWQRGDQTGITNGMTYDDTVERCNIQVTPIAGQSFTIYFSSFIKGFYAKPQIMVWSADNGANTYDMMFPYMQARGIPGSYMPTTDYLAAPNAQQITAAEITEMQDAGWTIVPHQTIGTGLTSMTQAEIEAEIDEVLAVHASYGWTFRKMYYPSGGNSNDTANAVYASRGISYGNNVNSSNHQVGRVLYGGLINPYKLWSYTADDKTFDQVKVAIDWCIKYGGHLGILWHDGLTEEAAFKASMDYLYRLKEANVIDVASYATFFNRLTNPRKVR